MDSVNILTEETMDRKTLRRLESKLCMQIKRGNVLMEKLTEEEVEIKKHLLTCSALRKELYKKLKIS